MNPSGISRRELLRLMGSFSLVSTAPRPWLSSKTASAVTFVDVVHSAGITFRHDNAASPEKYLIETMGSGCGWIDYDQNGLLDLLPGEWCGHSRLPPRNRFAALFTATTEMEHSLT